MQRRLAATLASCLLLMFSLVVSPPAQAAMDVAKQVLIGADYSNKDLQGATFNLSNLREANLSGSDLRGASLYGAKLQDADLSGTDADQVAMMLANDDIRTVLTSIHVPLSRAVTLVTRAAVLGGTKMGCYDTVKQELRARGWTDGIGLVFAASTITVSPYSTRAGPELAVPAAAAPAAPSRSPGATAPRCPDGFPVRHLSLAASSAATARANSTEEPGPRPTA